MIRVTDLASYLYCSRKLFLSRLGLYEFPKEAIVMGSIRHETQDKINKAEEELVKNVKEKKHLPELYDIYKKAHSEILRKVIRDNKERLKSVKLPLQEVFKKTWPLVLKESETRAFNIHSNITRFNVFGEELWKRLTPKIESEFKIKSENLQLKGIIDQIKIYGDDYVPVELKTGKMPHQGVWPGHLIQLGAYALLLEDKFKKQIKEGIVRYLAASEDRIIQIDEQLRKDVIEVRDRVINVFSAKELPGLCDNKKKCDACGMRDVCGNIKLIKKRMMLL